MHAQRPRVASEPVGSTVFSALDTITQTGPDERVHLVRVLVFCGDPGVPVHGPSGASAHLRDVATALSNLGHEVFVATIASHDERGRYAIEFGLPRTFVGKRTGPRGLRGVGRRLNARRLARRALKTFGEIDLVWERAGLHCDAGLMLARRVGARHVLEVNSPLDLENGRRGQLDKVVRATDRVLAVSPWMVNWARDRGAHQVLHLPNASALKPSGVPKLPVPTLVHHGSNRADHGVEFFPSLLEALPEVRLRVIGSGSVPEHPRLERLPWLSSAQLGPALEACHLGILPFNDDAPPWFDPLKAADYRAVGLAVLGSAHPSARGADRRVPRTDLTGWVQAVRELLLQRPCPSGCTWESAVSAGLAQLPEGGTEAARVSSRPGAGLGSGGYRLRRR